MKENVGVGELNNNSIQTKNHTCSQLNRKSEDSTEQYL